MHLTTPCGLSAPKSFIIQAVSTFYTNVMGCNINTSIRKLNCLNHTCCDGPFAKTSDISEDRIDLYHEDLGAGQPFRFAKFWT